MSPKLKLPSVALHCPGFPKSSDFIALDCPQFGNRIGDSCPALPSVTQRIGDGFGDGVRYATDVPEMQASFHASSSIVVSVVESQGSRRRREERGSPDPVDLTSPFGVFVHCYIVFQFAWWNTKVRVAQPLAQARDVRQ